MSQPRKVLVAMSGGVDSAAAAFLLKEQGYDVTGANMRFWEYPEEELSCDTGLDEKAQTKKATSCCSPADLADAEKVARAIGIPFYSIKMEADFEESVISPFIRDYKTGRTPNPCVECNTKIKFGNFYVKATQLGFDYVATGHYADIKRCSNGRWAITPAADSAKDQAYYLYGLSQEALSRTLFPLARVEKSEVRRIAAENSLPVAAKPESQEICFIPNNNYRDFLRERGVDFQEGFIRDTQGRILGKHKGKENFTIGQRRGLSIAVGHPLYVIDILENGDVIVGEKEDLNVMNFSLTNVCFQGLEATEGEGKALVQVRYNSPPALCTYRISGDEIQIQLNSPSGAITPGQAGVLYDLEDRSLLAGGKIKRS